MSWETFHRRSEVLRRVSDEANRRRDGRLPTNLAGVHERFADPADLLAALRLRWFNHLSGAIELELSMPPSDLEDAVVAAWCRAADDLPGVRMILDADLEAGGPSSRAQQKEWQLLASSARLAPGTEQCALAEGRRIENRARRRRAAELMTEPREEGPRTGSEVLRGRLRRMRRKDSQRMSAGDMCRRTP